jgi:hypothetical protein
MFDYRTLGFIFTLSILSLNFIVAYQFYAPYWYKWCYYMAFLCAFATHMTSPGVVSAKIIEPDNPTTYQENFILLFSGHGYVKPPHAHFSKVTQRMVLGHDHFCIWVGNDIGLMNFRYFIQFLFWSIVSCIVSMSCMHPIISGCFWDKQYSNCNILFKHGYKIYPLYMVCCLGLLFTSGLFAGAIQSIYRGMSDIDVAQGHYLNKMNAKDSYTIYFGNSIPVLYQFFPWPNSKRLKRRRARLEQVCSNYFEDNGVKVVYK